MVSGKQSQPDVVRPAPSNVNAPKVHQRKRLTVFSWNSGGLPLDQWDALQVWLSRQSIDIALIQESHWQPTTEWLQDKYYVMCSGLSNRRAGLICMVFDRYFLNLPEGPYDHKCSFVNISPRDKWTNPTYPVVRRSYGARGILRFPILSPFNGEPFGSYESSFPTIY